MSYITLRTTVTGIEVTGGGYNAVDLEIDGLDVDEVLKEIDAKDAVEAYGEDTLLDIIGEEAARKYFGIEEPQE